MLVLSRKVGERVRVGPDVWLTVVSVRGNKVRLGFEAPRGIEVAREELLPPTESRPPRPQPPAA